MPTTPTRGFGLSVDYKSFERALDAVGRKALPRAAAATMNRAATASVAALKEHALDVFDRPKPFTLQGFVIRKARVADGKDVSMSVGIKEPQASYLYRQIEGGVRRTGEDGGSGPHDLMTYALKPDRYGGVPRGLSKKLSAENKREKSARASARAAGKKYGRQGGIFFGTVNGRKGYWRRPRGREGSPVLLLGVSETARYRKRFRFAETVDKTYRKFTTAKEFNRELARQIDRVLAVKGGRR